MSIPDIVNPYEVPPSRVAAWQATVDLMAGLLEVPVALVMHVVGPRIEVLVASRTESNPYQVGDEETLEGSGLYCEEVIRTRDRLRVPNALLDERWRQNPDIRLGMIAYLGYPLVFPDGTPFGTLCVLDRRENPFGPLAVELLGKLRELVESELALVYMNNILAGKNRQLMDYIVELKTLRGLIPICARCKRIRREDDTWEELESYLTTHTEAQLTHGICPDCRETLYPQHPRTVPGSTPAP